MAAARGKDRDRWPRTRVALQVGIAAALGWTLALSVFGGFSGEALGIPVSSNDPSRPFVVGLLLTGTYALLYRHRLAPVTPPWKSWIRAWRLGYQAAARGVHVLGRVPPGVAAAALAGSLAMVGVAYGSVSAAGSDVYGYVSQADLWRSGDLRIEQPWVDVAPWPNAAWTFSPLGYRPGRGPGVPAIVPTYPPGLPILMAIASSVGGYGARFLIVPLGGLVLILATYGIGIRLAGTAPGLIGAWLVATSPAVLLHVVLPMSDVPCAAAWTLAMYLLMRGDRWAPTAAGLAAAMAIMIRPNIAFLAVILAMPSVWAAVQSGRRGAGVWRLVTFPALASTGALFVAGVNTVLYGSPLLSGYWDARGLFSASHLSENIPRYLTWLVDTSTPVVLAGLACVLVPVQFLWRPGPTMRLVWIYGSSVTIALWLAYGLYLVFDNSTYLRFLLPSWPLTMIGVGTVLRALFRMDTLLARLTAIAALAFRPVYALLQDWEVPEFERHFEGERLAQRLEARAALVYLGSSTLTLFALSASAVPPIPVTIVPRPDGHGTPRPAAETQPILRWSER